MFLLNIKFCTKNLNLEKGTHGHWHSEAVQKISSSCDDWQGQGRPEGLTVGGGQIENLPSEQKFTVRFFFTFCFWCMQREGRICAKLAEKILKL